MDNKKWEVTTFPNPGYIDVFAVKDKKYINPNRSNTNYVFWERVYEPGIFDSICKITWEQKVTFAVSRCNKICIEENIRDKTIEDKRKLAENVILNVTKSGID
jgi:hypothetical protein